jgi:L-glutamine-phosphate cytidylyltransferase
LDALILAAGQGTRMGGIDKPKCLLDIGGISIIKYQIKCLKNAGINKIFIVTGYHSELLRSHLSNDFVFLYNVDFATTNNLYSVWTAKDSIKDDFICIYGDLLFDKKILDNCIQDKNNVCLVVEKNIRGETMKVKIKNDSIIELNKSISEEDASGNFIGMAKFRKPIISLLFKEISKLVKDNNFNSYYTSAIESMIKDNQKINFVETKNLSWMDIDEKDEFQQAKKLFHEMSETNS